MTEQPKRSSRLKKNPKYFHSDIYNTLHPDQVNQKWDFASGKAPQNTSTSQPIAKVPDAKLLCNFINNANKYYQDYRNQMAQENMNTAKKEIANKQKKEEVKSQATKKGSSVVKQAKTEIAKKNKEMGKLKNSYNNTKQPQNMSIIRTEQNYMDKIKLAHSQVGLGANMPMNGVYSDSLKRQYEKLQYLYKLNYMSPNPTNTNQSNQYQIGILNGSQFTTQKQCQKTKKESQKNNHSNSEQRVFKRSAYHVAIAYHIYLKNLKQKKGPNMQNQIDPTYFARRLKETKTETINE